MPKPAKYSMIRESTNVDIGGLAGFDCAIGAGPAIVRDLFDMKIEGSVHVEDFEDNDPPILYGLADGDLTAAEIEECIESNGPLHPGDVTLEEQANRRVLYVGVLTGRPETDTVIRPAKWLERNVRQTWTEDAPGWVWWAYNLSDGAVSATTSLKIRVTHFVRWLA